MARRAKQDLTPGEQDVLNLIERGNAIDQIAEVKEIGASAVYHYIRRLKDKGHLHVDQRIPSKGSVSDVTFPTAADGVTPVSVAPANGNGHGYEKAYDALIKAAQSERAAIDRLTSEISETEQMLEEERGHLAKRQARYDSLEQASKSLDVELVDKTLFEAVT